MSLANPQQVPEQLPYELVESPPRRSGSGAVLAAVALLAIAGGLGYYAFTLQTERDSVRTALQTASADVVKLRAQTNQDAAKIGTLERDAQERAQLIVQAKTKLDEVNAELAATQTRLDELDAERGEIHEQLAEFKQMTLELKRMIDSGRLEVTFRRGRMIVGLPAQVLFPSGSADLTPEGREALEQVAKSLRGFKSRNFIVAGHTDNVPVAGGKFASNWDLSSARAVIVTDALIHGGLKPEQLVAAGYSEYDPIAKNTNEAGKQKNRRIEIILEPRLRQIPGLNEPADKKKEASDKKEPAAKAKKQSDSK